MSDEKLRELERRWKETGAVEDEAAFLLGRVRVGELTQERLRWAAALGNEAAMSLNLQPIYGEIDDCLASGELGEGTLRLFACDCAERVLPSFEKQFPAITGPRDALVLSRRFVSTGKGEADLLAATEEQRWGPTALFDSTPRCRAARAARAATLGDARNASLHAARSRALSFRDDPRSQGIDRYTEEEWQCQRLCEYLLRQAPSED